MKYIMRTITIVFLLILGLAVVSASPDLFFKTGIPADIKVPCVNDGLACNNTASCNITISYPNGTLLTSNTPMTFSTTYFNYSLADTSTIGEYDSYVYCGLGGEFGSNFFTFKINGTGEENINTTSLVVFMLIMTIISFTIAGFIFNSNKWLFYVFFLLGFVFSTVLAFFGWQMSLDWGAWSGILYAIFFTMMIFTFFMFMLVMVELTIVIVTTLGQKRDRKLGDNLL